MQNNLLPLFECVLQDGSGTQVLNVFMGVFLLMTWHMHTGDPAHAYR
jgi:hypothetical protein